MKKVLSLVLTAALLLSIAIPAIAFTPGNANQNSRTNGIESYVNATVIITGNGNSARLNTILTTKYGLSVTQTEAECPINNKINTIYIAGFEIDVFVRGNKIDRIDGIWDLNCYRECFDCGDYCTPTRDNPCACECTCLPDSSEAWICPPCRNGVGNNHSNCFSNHNNQKQRDLWWNCECCGAGAK